MRQLESMIVHHSLGRWLAEGERRFLRGCGGSLVRGVTKPSHASDSTIAEARLARLLTISG